jgi:hypothetical protein
MDQRKHVNDVSLIPIVCAAVFGISLCSAFTILDAPFWGEDELLLLNNAAAANQAISQERIDSLARILLRDYHPPARTLMAMPFVWMLGPTGAAIRLPNCVMWGLVCSLAAALGIKLGGIRVGWVTGLFLGCSGLFNLFAMGHGHAGEALFVLAVLGILTDQARITITAMQDIRRYVIGGVLLAAGFLYFTSLLPIALLYHAIYLASLIHPTIRDDKVTRRFISCTVAFAFFYVSYYVLLLGIPLMIFDDVSGQLHQNLVRASAARLNTHSLLENILALNWYVFPWLHIPILIMGVCEMYRRCVWGFWITLPFGLLFSFYLQGMTGVHFFAYFCWVVPFAIARLFGLHCVESVAIKKLIAGLFVATVFAWSCFVHIREYSYESYPDDLCRIVCGHIYWPNNRAPARLSE